MALLTLAELIDEVVDEIPGKEQAPIVRSLNKVIRRLHTEVVQPQRLTFTSKQSVTTGTVSATLASTALTFSSGVLGAILINLVAKRTGKGKLLLLGMLFDGVTYAVLYFCGSLPLMGVLIAFHALGIPFIVVSRTALIQEWVPAEMQGRVFALVGMAVVGTTAISCGAVGVLSEYVPVNVIFGVFGTVATLCGVVGAFYGKLREG